MKLLKQISIITVLLLVFFLPQLVTAQTYWGAISEQFPPQNDIFTVEFDLVPRDSSVTRAHVLFSEYPTTTWSDGACILRCDPAARVFDVRNGGGYGAENVVPYETGKSYHVTMLISVGDWTYDTYIKELPDGEDIEVTLGAEFRTDQVDAGIDTIQYYNVMVPYISEDEGIYDSAADLKNFVLKDFDGNVIYEDEGTTWTPPADGYLEPEFPPTMKTGPFPFGTEEVRADAPVDTNDPTEVIHEYTAYKGTVTVDGDLSDPAWAAIPWTLMEYNLNWEPREEGSLWDADYAPTDWYGWEDLSVWFKMIHDDDNIYVAYMRYDDDFNYDPATYDNVGNIWQNDAVQLIVDTRFPFDFEEEMPGAEIGVSLVDDTELYQFWSTSNQNPAVQLELAEGDNMGGHETTDGKAIHGMVEETETGFKETMEIAFVKYDDMYDDMLGMFSICALDRDFDANETVNQWAQGIFVKTAEEYGSVLWSAQPVPMTGVENNARTIPANYVLDQNYPNPFNPTTTISYELPATETVSLHVYSITGQQVATLLQHQVQTAGVHQVTFDASQLSSGVYFYQLQTASTSLVKKMTLIR